MEILTAIFFGVFFGIILGYSVGELAVANDLLTHMFGKDTSQTEESEAIIGFEDDNVD